jgi:hypothetical protein
MGFETIDEAKIHRTAIRHLWEQEKIDAELYAGSYISDKNYTG